MNLSNKKFVFFLGLFFIVIFIAVYESQQQNQNSDVAVITIDVNGREDIDKSSVLAGVCVKNSQEINQGRSLKYRIENKKNTVLFELVADQQNCQNYLK